VKDLSKRFFNQEIPEEEQNRKISFTKLCNEICDNMVQKANKSVEGTSEEKQKIFIEDVENVSQKLPEEQESKSILFNIDKKKLNKMIDIDYYDKQNQEIIEGAIKKYGKESYRCPVCGGMKKYEKFNEILMSPSNIFSSLETVDKKGIKKYFLGLDGILRSGQSCTKCILKIKAEEEDLRNAVIDVDQDKNGNVKSLGTGNPNSKTYIDNEKGKKVKKEVKRQLVILGLSEKEAKRYADSAYAEIVIPNHPDKEDIINHNVNRGGGESKFQHTGNDWMGIPDKRCGRWATREKHFPYKEYKKKYDLVRAYCKADGTIYRDTILDYVGKIPQRFIDMVLVNSFIKGIIVEWNGIYDHVWYKKYKNPFQLVGRGEKKMTVEMKRRIDGEKYGFYYFKGWLVLIVWQSEWDMFWSETNQVKKAELFENMFKQPKDIDVYKSHIKKFDIPSIYNS